MISEYKSEMQQMALIYSEETEKDFRDQVNDMDYRAMRLGSDPLDLAVEKLSDKGYPILEEDMEHLEFRIEANHYFGTEFDSQDLEQEDDADRGWNPYEQDLSNYPEIFKMYGENFDRYERAKKKFSEEDPKEWSSEDAHSKRIPKNLDAWEKKYDDFMPRFRGTGP